MRRFSKEEKLHTWLLLKNSVLPEKFRAGDGVFRKKKSCIPDFC
jgi:hypothetical protein